MRLALAVLVAALVLPAAAAAHITIAPPFVEDGVETEISLTVPNERPPHATVAVRATIPAGVSIESAAAPEGWRATIDGSTVTWSGGRIEGRSDSTFPLRIRANVRAGTYAVAASQTYDDAATVRWTSDLSVLPATGTAAPDQRPWAAIVAAVVGIVVIAGSLLPSSSSARGDHFKIDSGTGCYRRFVIFHQFLNDDLGCACYLIGDEEAGIAVVVDPPFAIEPLVAEAGRRGLEIVRTVETHTHADHVSGHGRLALEHGIPVSVHADAGVDYPNDPMHDGDEIAVGAVTLCVIHSPGHRPEHCCLTVVDNSRGR